MRPALPTLTWKTRPKLGWDAVTEMEVALRELREDRERQERERAPQPKESK